MAMKKINTSLALLFLLLAFTTKLNLAIANDIRDTGGNLLENGGASYYFIDYDNAYGGVSVATIGATKPLAVVQLTSKKNLGLSVGISNVANTRIISTDDRVKIFPFGVSNCCNASWGLVNDELAKVWYIGISCDGKKTNDQIKTGYFQFQIQGNGLYYTLSYCGYTNSNTTFCDLDVGVFADSAKNRLLAIGPISEGFTFRLKRAP